VRAEVQRLGEEAITPRVRQFITDHVESVMQLEVLLLLAAQPGKVWTATELAQQLRIDEAWVDAQIRGMGARGLVGVAEGPPPQFRYDPRAAELGQAVAELAQAYADRRVTVIGLIFSKPVDKLRSFADAFRIRKDRSE
jgi:DNA-binding MarR family transcriptional regulator